MNDKAPFPLLIKIRVLQILSNLNHYSKVDKINSILIKFGYKITFLDDILVELQASRYIRLRQDNNNNQYLYKITNKGLLTIDIFCLENVYLQHIIPVSMLPKEVVLKMNPFGSYTQSPQDTIKDGIRNVYIFMNLVEDIEKIEKKHLGESCSLYSDFFIYNKMKTKIKIATTKILNTAKTYKFDVKKYENCDVFFEKIYTSLGNT